MDIFVYRDIQMQELFNYILTVYEPHREINETCHVYTLIACVQNVCGDRTVLTAHLVEFFRRQGINVNVYNLQVTVFH